MDAEVRADAHARGPDGGAPVRRRLPSPWTWVAFILTVLVLGLLQLIPFEFWSSTPYFFCRGGLPATSYTYLELYRPGTFDNPGRFLDRVETRHDGWGHAINLTLLGSLCGMIWVVDRAFANGQFALRTLFTLMLLAAVALGMFAVARVHNAQLGERMSLPSYVLDGWQ